MTKNSTLKDHAIVSLENKWGSAALTVLLFSIITGISQIIPFFGPIISIFISGPFALGLAIYFMNIARGSESKFEQIFDGFKSFTTALGAYLLMAIFVFLWSLLLIIPGIIAGLAYSMTYFVIVDNPSIGAFDALKKSKKIMDGYKMKLFLLLLSFIGWALLCILSLGIGFLWLMPYIQVTLVKFYDEIKNTQEELNFDLNK